MRDFHIPIEQEVNCRDLSSFVSPSISQPKNSLQKLMRCRFICKPSCNTDNNQRLDEFCETNHKMSSLRIRRYSFL